MAVESLDFPPIRAIKQILSEELKSPTPEFVKFFASQIYPKRLTAVVLEQFIITTQKAFNQFIKESINSRLKTALSENSDESEDNLSVDGQAETEEDNGINTTIEELEGLHIIRAILREIIPQTEFFIEIRKVTLEFYLMTIIENLYVVFISIQSKLDFKYKKKLRFNPYGFT